MSAPMQLVKGKHYKIYVESRLPSRAELMRRALAITSKDKYHEEFIDFIPARFTLQLHGWTSKKTSVAELKRLVREHYSPNKENIIKHLPFGKWHFDIRNQKLSAPSWFGMTAFREPWIGRQNDKVQCVPKGFETLTKEGQVMKKKIQARKESRLERMSELRWMSREGVIPPGQEGNPTVNQWSYMVVIEKAPAVVHRREIDFLDITYLGKYLRGRYYFRLVERKRSVEEQAKTFKRPETVNFFYCWKALDQFDLDLMQKVAENKVRLESLRVEK